MRGIAIREELTDEWKHREVGEDREYAILTAEISKATFGMTPSQYKKFKGLQRENLRDHMDDLELIFSMLGEAATTRITKAKNTKGFPQNKQVAREGGAIGNARHQLEKNPARKFPPRNHQSCTRSQTKARYHRYNGRVLVSLACWPFYHKKSCQDAITSKKSLIHRILIGSVIEEKLWRRNDE